MTLRLLAGRADDDRERPRGTDVESVDDFDRKLVRASVAWCTGEAAQCRYQANPVREATAPELPHRRTNASDGGQFGAVEVTDCCAGQLLSPDTEPRWARRASPAISARVLRYPSPLRRTGTSPQSAEFPRSIRRHVAAVPKGAFRRPAPTRKRPILLAPAASSGMTHPLRAQGE